MINLKQRVNRLFAHEIRKGGRRVKHREASSWEFVTNEELKNGIRAFKELIGEEFHKIGPIPGRAIINKIEEIDPVFHEEQEKHRKDNPNFRNTEMYTPTYYNVLHVFNDLELLEYYQHKGYCIVYKKLLEIPFDKIQTMLPKRMEEQSLDKWL